MIFSCLNDLCPKSRSWCIMSRKPVVCGNCEEVASEILMRKWQEEKRLLGESNIHLDWIKDKYLLSGQSRIKSLPPWYWSCPLSVHLSSRRETRTITLCILLPLAAAKGETKMLPNVPTSQGFSSLTYRLHFPYPEQMGHDFLWSHLAMIWALHAAWERVGLPPSTPCLLAEQSPVSNWGSHMHLWLMTHDCRISLCNSSCA